MFDRIKEKLVALFAPEILERRDLFERLANTDELTGLANRRAFEMARASAEKSGLGFVVFDLNNFGRLNKSLGHAEGDRILRLYAKVIAQAAKRFKGRAFRYGGDEFVIVVPRRFLCRVRDAVERRSKVFDLGTFFVSVTGSVGASFAEADRSLQERKRAAKSNILPFRALEGEKSKCRI